MLRRFERDKPLFALQASRGKQKGIIPAVLAVIIAFICIALILLIGALIFWIHHLVAGLIGGGNQPGGNCNVGCGFDTSKIDFYTHGDAPNVDAASEEAKNFAINTLKVDPSQIVIFGKSTVENMIRAEVASQWSQLKPEQQHGATQADAQHALLAYQEHESSAFQLFKQEGGRLVPSLTIDSSGICTNILSITKDKWEGNKRKQIAYYWDIKFDIYTGVQENINNFVNRASGSGQERWKNALGITFWPGDPGRYWRQSSAETAWNKYKNEAAYNCQSVAGCTGDTGPYTGKRTTYAGIEEALGRACDESQLVTINFMGRNVEVHKKAAPAFEAVVRDIKASNINYNFWDESKCAGMSNGGTYNCRMNINGPGQSPHSYGIAIDINPGHNIEDPNSPCNPNYRRTRRPGSCTTDIPIQVVQIFKSHGFRWGGEFRRVCDSMHFEWMNW